MTALLFSASGRVTAGAAPEPPVPSEEVVAAQVWRWDGNDGEVLVSSGFPMLPGRVTDDTLDQVRVFVDGVEQAVAVEPMRGRFQDGSYRSVGIQFLYTLTNNVPVTAEVRVDGSTRGTTDRVWQEPVYDSGSVTTAGTQNRAVIAPSDPNYICNTFICLVPLQPAAADVNVPATTAKFFETTGVDAWNAGSVNQTLATWANQLYRVPLFGTATYEDMRGMAAAWARSGLRQWYERGYNRVRARLTQTTFSAVGVNNPAYSKVYGADSSLPAVGANEAGLPAEWNAGIYFGYATWYWLMGWRQPWRSIAHHASHISTGITSYAVARGAYVTGTYLTRFNMQRQISPVLAAYLVEATMQVPGGYGVGRVYGQVPFATELDWILDALEEFTYSNYASYIDGYVGQRQTATEEDTLPAGVFPTFQAFVVARVLIAWYDNVYPDARIPGWLEAIGEFVLTQVVDFSTHYRVQYLHDADPTNLTVDEAYFLPMFSQLFGWLWASTGDTKWRTWGDRATNSRELLNPGSFTPLWKAWGEYFAGEHQSYLYYRNGGQIRASGAVHPTAYVEPREFAS